MARELLLKNIQRKPPPKGGYSGFLGLKFSISGFWGVGKFWHV